MTTTCDICKKPIDGYSFVNSTYGTCEEEKCHTEAELRWRHETYDEVMRCMEDGDFDGAEEALGDRDIFEVM